MRIVLGTDLGDGGFPGPLAGGVAVFDEAWVDVAGLVAILEVRLGIASRDPPGHAERAAALARVLRDAGPAPWSRSLEVDPLATAHAVLRVRDAMRLAGIGDDVKAELLPARLSAVHTHARGALPGLPERIAACVQALRGGERARVERVALVDAPSTLPRAVHALLSALEADGAVVDRHTVEVADVDPRSDLGQARGDGEATYVGDGSLLLLRPDTVDEAAADVAAFIAAQPSPVVVIGADLVLDEALARVGGPTLGARGDVGSDALLPLLPLAVALGDAAPDPERLFEACGLPVTFFPRGLAGRIRRALVNAPSALAAEVLGAVLTAVVDRGTKYGDAARTALEDRLALVVPAWAQALGRTSQPIGDGGTIDVAAVRVRATTLLQLLFGRQARDFGDDERTPYRAAIRQVGVFLRLLDQLDVVQIPVPQLQRLLRSATASVRAAAPWAATAGVVRLSRPGALLAPAPIVVWWGFTRESGRLPPRTLFVDERRRLQALGFDPASLDAVAASWADASRRPLLCTAERLLLCAPQRGASGREHHPHPLWDEILARAPSSERRAALRNLVRPDDDGERGLTPRVPPTAVATPKRRALHVIPPGSVLPREVTSPSREELLLGCGLRFVLEERGAKARSFRVKHGVALEGDVVHAVIGAVLKGGLDDHVAARARAAFDALVPTMAGAWLRPGREQVRLRVRERAARAAVALVDLILDNDLDVVAIEEEVTKELPTSVDGTVIRRAVRGTPDLVLHGRVGGQAFPVVVDHKTGREHERRHLLQLGVPLQLLTYARLVGDKQLAPPGVGYFIIRSRRLLTTDERLKGVELIVPERSARDGWLLLEEARALAFRDLARGQVTAPGAEGATTADAVVDGGRVILGAPCRWCRADVVCGRAWRQDV